MTTPPNQTNEEIMKDLKPYFTMAQMERIEDVLRVKEFEKKDALASQEERHKEIVICAAVIEEDGTIIRGHRHSDCFAAIQNRGKKAIKRDDGLTQQGFITSKNRFVDRKEALRLQVEAGILSVNPRGAYIGNELYSEDLY